MDDQLFVEIAAYLAAHDAAQVRWDAASRGMAADLACWQALPAPVQQYVDAQVVALVARLQADIRSYATGSPGARIMDDIDGALKAAGYVSEDRAAISPEDTVLNAKLAKELEESVHLTLRRVAIRLYGGHTGGVA